MHPDLASTIKILAEKGRGILAADESSPTIAKRFASINVESTEEMRRAYREMLFTTPKLGQYINGVILYEETLGQSTKDGKPFTKLLMQEGILPGIKVDKGLVNLTNTKEEKVTQGLDGLEERLKAFKNQGALFAKWRAVFDIDASKPSCLAQNSNAENLARYAAMCQSVGIVPIVEPELLMDGANTIERCAEASEAVWRKVFRYLNQHGVSLEHMVLKPSMVISGKQCATQADVDSVANATIKILLRAVPAAVPTVNFLSGGQSPELSTAHLNRMNALHPNRPWNLSFSYGRALQEPALKAWQGKDANVPAAQAALFKRAKLNAMAAMGEYQTEMEKE